MEAPNLHEAVQMSLRGRTNEELRRLRDQLHDGVYLMESEWLRRGLEPHPLKRIETTRTIIPND